MMYNKECTIKYKIQNRILCYKKFERKKYNIYVCGCVDVFIC
jgi:hypothetical protein